MLVWDNTRQRQPSRFAHALSHLSASGPLQACDPIRQSGDSDPAPGSLNPTGIRRPIRASCQVPCCSHALLPGAAPAGAGVAHRKYPLPWSPGSQSRPVARSPPGPPAGTSAAQPIADPTSVPVPAPMRIRRERARIRSACPSGLRRRSGVPGIRSPGPSLLASPAGAFHPPAGTSPAPPRRAAGGTAGGLLHLLGLVRVSWDNTVTHGT